MELHLQREDARQKPSLFGRAIAAVVALGLVLTGSLGFAAAANAASGTINSIELTTVYDGAVVPNDLDDGANNGVVASNDVVGFRWDLNATDLVDGVFTQTLPEGWKWDESSLASLNSSSSAYQSSYVISDDGRTLTATVSVGNGSGNPSVVGFGTLKAIPSGDVANGSVYNPELNVTVGESAQSVTTGPIEVRNVAMAEMTKVRGANNGLGQFDFGNGPEQGRFVDFTVAIRDAHGTVGARNIELQQPLVVNDSYTIQAPEGFEDAQFVAQLISTSEAGAQVQVAQSGADLTLTFDGFASIPDASAVIRFWIPNNEVPSDSIGVVKIVNTVSQNNWVDTTGEPVIESPNGNVAEGTVSKAPSFGPFARDKSIFLFNDQAGSFDVTADPATGGQPFTNVSGREISIGSTIASRLMVRAAVDNETNTTTGATNLVAYDFWNNAEQTIVDGADIYVGQNSATTPLDPSMYTIQYTTGSDADNPQANTWVNSIAAAGGAASVRGIRIAYTAGVWADGGNPATSAFVVAAPFTIVAPAGTSAQDHGRWSFTDFQGEPRTAAMTQFVNVGNFQLQLDKQVNRSSIVSGSNLEYTLVPGVVRAIGATEDIDVREIQIVDTLPKGLVAVNTDDVASPWQVTRSGTAESGLVLTFTYEGIVKTGEALPEITYDVTTSVLAPVDSVLVNTATISALGSTQTVQARTDTTTTSVFQAEVITEEKVVLGEEQIQVQDPQVSWEGRWFNFQTTSQGQSYFVDVLPYNGDARGTEFAGTAKLATAIVTNGSGTPAPEGYGTLQYTTAPAAEVYAAAANDDSIEWIDADGVDFSTLTGVTALRVIVADFASGSAGIGGLLVTMDVEGQEAGDRYVNNINGWLGEAGELGLSNPAEVTVVASSIAGVVWNDLNEDGVRDADEPLIAGATVTLVNAAGETIATTITGDDGGYLFDQLPAGEYRTIVDTSTLGFPENFVVTNTYDLDGNLDSDSGVITLGKAEDRTGVDFGYVTRVSDIDLTKSGTLAGDARVGEWVDWTFTITNTGENPLTAVELVDHLEGVVDLTVTWPGEAGILAAGATATATAHSQLVQEDIDRGFVVNTATVSGLDPNETPVDDPAEATVEFDPASSITLIKKTNGVEYQDAPGAALTVGDEVLWTYEITNTGTTTLRDVVLVDDQEGTITAPDSFDGVLSPGESITFSAEGVATAGQYHNVAVVTATTPGGATVNAEDESWYNAETVVVPTPPTPSDPVTTPPTTPQPSGTPGVTPAPEKPAGLPVTGAMVNLGIAFGALLLLAAGGVLLLIRRRRA
ncbi:DUF7507 domain-containing protein [Humidisolicoccus flavus]|uniref:DUF7507 domain-containing protein n=1 Tax=Humidisolicoccus flavus TaxID=3111414 RepID=UPI00324E252F